MAQAVIIVACYFAALKNTRPMSRVISGLLLATGVNLASEVTYFMAVSPGIANVAMTVFELSRLLFCIIMVEIMLRLSNRRTPGWMRIAFLVAFVLDGIYLVVNLFNHHIFEIDITKPIRERITYGDLYVAHVGVLVGVLSFAVILGLIKMARNNYIYWQKFAMLIFFISFLIYVDIAHRGNENYIFLISGLYFIYGVASYFFMLVIRSKVLRATEYAKVFDSITQYFFLFDNDGDCVLVNRKAVEFFGLDEFDLEKAGDLVLGLIHKGSRTENGDFVSECNVGGTTYYLRVDNNEIYEMGFKAGEYYAFTDVTKTTIELTVERHMARFDSFTMIFNQGWFLSEVESIVSKNPEEDYYIIGSDIRDFKVFNEVFGKDAGDKVIHHIVETLRYLYDNGYIVLFGRIYADRFGMLAKKDGYNESEIVSHFVNMSHPFNDDYYHLNIHFGVYNTSMEPGLPAKSMLDRAYVALDSIKNEVNVRVYHYNEIMRNEKIWEQTISGNIERAIKEGQLRIVVQPQVNKEEKVIGGEALVRWRHPVNGEISPGNFIPVLEKTGLVTNADVYVWEEACKLLRRWKDLGYEQYYISVNISATDFMFADIYAIFTNLVEKYEINPNRLKLEITETAMMTDVLERIVLIKRLEERGFVVELDDFGSGYSSLNMLKEIPVDVIKMDMKFLYNYNNESTANSHKIIGHIIKMAKDLNMEIIAEGVETREQLAFLQDSGCDVFQGYLFSKPVEIAEFERLQGIA